MRIYNVDLNIIGPIKVVRTIEFNTDKELELGAVFNSDILIKPYQLGAKISTTVRTVNEDQALKIAFLFIGKMLDVLSIKADIPLLITNSDVKTYSEQQNVTAVITPDEFEICFKRARILNLQYTTLLRAITWYRKGLYTDDPFDKFLALWNSITVIAGKYCESNERTRQGTINQIWDCFVTLWGLEYVNSNFKNGDVDLIKVKNDIRNNIAHGIVPVEINYVQEVIEQLADVKKLAFSFITKWANDRLGQSLR